MSWESGFVFLCWLCLLSLGDVFVLGQAFAGVFGSLFSGPCSHCLVVSAHSTGRSFLCQAGSEDFSLGIVGWTVVGGYGRHGLHSGRMSVVSNTAGCAYFGLLVPI